MVCLAWVFGILALVLWLVDRNVLSSMEGKVLTGFFAALSVMSWLWVWWT